MAGQKTPTALGTENIGKLLDAVRRSGNHRHDGIFLI